MRNVQTNRVARYLRCYPLNLHKSKYQPVYEVHRSTYINNVAKRNIHWPGIFRYLDILNVKPQHTTIIENNPSSKATKFADPYGSSKGKKNNHNENVNNKHPDKISMSANTL